MRRTTYKKGESAGIEGIKFQVYVLTVLLLNSLKRLENNWKLSTENEEIGDYNKFDDAVLELDDGSAVLLQAKHKKKTKKKKTSVTLDQLLSTNSKNDTFSLPKYFFSFLRTKDKFQPQTVVICTNASIDSKVSGYVIPHSILPDNILYYLDDRCSYHTFNEKILPELERCAKIYHEDNLKGKGFNESEITESNLKEFLENLQFYSDYHAGIEVIENLLFSMKCLGNVFSKASPQDVYNKVQDWFEQPKGEYLTECRAKALFCEINSDRYFHTLENYNVLFEPDQFLNVTPKRLTHVVVDGEYLLHAIRTHQLLKSNKRKMLCISPDDDIDVQRQVVEAFTMPSYKFLIIIWRKISTTAKEMCTKLGDVLVADKNKEVVIVASSNLQSAQQMESLETDVITERVTLQSLSRSTRERLSNDKRIVFQGKEVSLKELFETHVGYENEVDAETLAKLVRGETIRVGSDVVSLDEDVSHYYINRVFKRDVKESDEEERETWTRHETFSERNIYDVNERVITVMDVAGAGKTTVLTKLAGDIKEKNSHLWVIMLELSSYTKVLKETTLKNRDAIDVLEVLNSKLSTKLTNQLEKIVFSLTEKVILMLDGVDEISPDYTQLVVNLLQQCYNAPNLAKLFISGRSHMTELLERKFHNKSFALEPLTEMSQIHFLTEYWLRNLEVDDTHKKRCSQYAKALVELMSLWIKLDSTEETAFTAVPLQVKMLADIFIKSNHLEDSADWEGCYQFLNGNHRVPKLPQKISISMLYQMFIERKRNVFVDKGNPDGIPAANHALIFHFDECLTYHRILALEVILDSSKCEFFSFYRKAEVNVEEDLLRVGILRKFDKEFRFVHRTFAEYFFAESVLTDLRKNSQAQFQKFLFDEMLSDSEFDVIRTFFDELLNKNVDSLPSNIFQNYQSLSYNIDLQQSSVLIHDLARDGCVATLKLLFKCIDFKTIGGNEAEIADILIALFGDPIPESVSSNKLIILQQLTKQHGINIIDDDSETPLRYAVVNGHLGMVKFLVEHEANVKANNDDGVSILEEAVLMDRPQIVTYLFNSILSNECEVINDDPIIPYTIAYLGRLEILKDLVMNNLNVNSALRNDETLIFGAARGEQIDAIKYLVSCGADIHAQEEEEGNTVLHFVCKKGSLLPAVELLVKLGSDVNIKNFSGNTPLHLGVATLDIVTLLVENKATVNSKNGQGLTAVAVAVSRGLVETAKFLVDKGADVNTVNNFGDSLLHLAASSGQLETVEYIAALVNVNVRNNQGRTPLHVAATHGHMDVVKFFMDNGGEAHIKDESGTDVLLEAVSENQLSVVKFLVGYGENVNNTRDDGSTALHLAVFRCHSDMIQYLVDVGVDINIRDNKGKTALHVAAALDDRLEIIKTLVKLDVDLNIADDQQCTALHLAALTHCWDNLKFLLDSMGYVNGEKHESGTLYFVNKKGDQFEIFADYYYNGFLDSETGFYHAARKGQLDIVKFYVELGVNVDIQTDNATTPLHIATSSGRLNIAEYLLDRGANVELRDNAGLSILHFAALSGRRQVLDFFLECKVDIDVSDNDGRTVLSYAIDKCDLDTVKSLVARGANVTTRRKDGSTFLHESAVRDRLETAKLFVELVDVDIKNDSGCSALHLAALHGSLHTFKFLIERGADVASVDNRNRTILHAAVLGGWIEITETILGLGVAVDSKDCEGCTALHLASEKGNLRIVVLLLKRGADVDAKNAHGRTALHCAVLECHLGIVRCLVGSGADVNVKDNDGCISLHLAALENRSVKLQRKFVSVNFQLVYQSIVEFLLEQGADINSKNYSGHTAADLADDQRNFYLIRYLRPQKKEQ